MTVSHVNGVDRDVIDLRTVPPEALIREPVGGPKITPEKAPEAVEGRVVARSGAAPYQPTPAPWERDYSHREPVLPPWLRSRDDWRHAVKHWRAEARYWTGVGFIRLLPRIVLYSPRGLWRALSAYWTWQCAMESRQMRLDAAAANNSIEWGRLEGLRKQAVLRRGVITAVTVGLWLAVTLIANITMLIIWGTTTVKVVAVMVVGVVWFASFIGCGFLGRPLNKPMLTLPEKAETEFRPDPEMIRQAFDAAGITTPKTGPVVLTAVPHRDGNGWRIPLKLPRGVDAEDVVKKRGKLASGLDVKADQLFLADDTGKAFGSQRNLEMWVSDVVPSTIPAGETPLLQAEAVDFWKPFPIGLDERGSLVMLTLLWQSMVISGLTRMGKTWTQRLFVLAAALDPHVRLLIFDLKPSPNDWIPFRPVAHEFHHGIRFDPHTGLDSLARLNKVLDDLLEEVERRGHTLSTLPISVCPEGKLTPHLARSASSRMPLILLVIDEVHEAFMDIDYGAQIGIKLDKLARRGAAVGISALTSTQKPGALKGHKKSGVEHFNNFRDGCSAKAALRVGSTGVSEMCLGQGTKVATGMDASRLPIDAKGTIYLNGASSEVAIPSGMIRTHLCDTVGAQKIVERARALRERAGTLSGMAVGETPAPEDDTPVRSIIADLLHVFGHADQLHSDKLAARLTAEWPDAYPGWAQGTVGVRGITLALKAHGIIPGDTWDPEPLVPDGQDHASLNKTGIKRADLIAVAERMADEKARRAGHGAPDDDDDDQAGEVAPELLEQAAELVITTQHATTKMLQRKLRVGHAEATAIMAALADFDVVAEGSGDSWDVLVDRDDLDSTLLMIRE